MSDISAASTALICCSEPLASKTVHRVAARSAFLRPKPVSHRTACERACGWPLTARSRLRQVLKTSCCSPSVSMVRDSGTVSKCSAYLRSECSFDVLAQARFEQVKDPPDIVAEPLITPARDRRWLDASLQRCIDQDVHLGAVRRYDSQRPVEEDGIDERFEQRRTFARASRLTNPSQDLPTNDVAVARHLGRRDDGKINLEDLVENSTIHREPRGRHGCGSEGIGGAHRRSSVADIDSGAVNDSNEGKRQRFRVQANLLLPFLIERRLHRALPAVEARLEYAEVVGQRFGAAGTGAVVPEHPGCPSLTRHSQKGKSQVGPRERGEDQDRCRGRRRQRVERTDPGTDTSRVDQTELGPEERGEQGEYAQGADLLRGGFVLGCESRAPGVSLAGERPRLTGRLTGIGFIARLTSEQLRQQGLEVGQAPLFLLVRRIKLGSRRVRGKEGLAS